MALGCDKLWQKRDKAHQWYALGDGKKGNTQRIQGYY